MDKVQRNYVKDRLHQVFKEKKKAIEDDTTITNKPITGTAVLKGIVEGTFPLRKTGSLESNYDGPSIGSVFAIPGERFRITMIDSRVRNRRLTALEKKYRKALDEIMLNDADADLVAVLRAFEAIKP